MISNVISFPRVRFVLDTCVIVAALRSRNGASHQILRLALQGTLPVVCHYKLLAEYTQVLTRMANAGELEFSPEETNEFLAALVTASEEVHVRYLWRPNLQDEADNFVLEAAIAASPSVLITHNLRDFKNSELNWNGVRIQTPQQALKESSRHA
jgi:uncharacterized protein